MKNYILIQNDDELQIMLGYFEDNQYAVLSGDLKELTRGAFPCVIQEFSEQRVVSLRYTHNDGSFKETGSFERYCEMLENEDNSCFYDNMGYYLDYNAPTLDSYCANWTLDLNEDEVNVIIEGKSYTSSITLAAAWPDHLCCRVRINDKYYYFS